MASSVERKEQTIRRREGRGEKEFSGATAVIWARIEASDVGWKRKRSCRSVIRSVFEGGEGCESGGRLDRSRVREGRDEEREEEERLDGVVAAGGGDEVPSVAMVQKVATDMVQRRNLAARKSSNRLKNANLCRCQGEQG